MATKTKGTEVKVNATSKATSKAAEAKAKELAAKQEEEKVETVIEKITEPKVAKAKAKKGGKKTEYILLSKEKVSKFLDAFEDVEAVEPVRKLLEDTPTVTLGEGKVDGNTMTVTVNEVK